MKIRILRRAMRHLAEDSRFYEQQALGLGTYFRNSVVEDIGRLNITAGVPEGFYRAISRRFPFAIYYTLEDDVVVISAILDSRRDPNWIEAQLR